MERIAIQSDISNVIKIEDFVSRICDAKNVNNYFATISTAVLLAVENAIQHGNASDAGKRVFVESGDCRGGIFFSITDQGAGFDYQQYGEVPTEGDRGEGIFMMRMLSDKLEYTDGGRTVTMQFYIKGIDDQKNFKRILTLQNFYSPVEAVV